MKERIFSLFIGLVFFVVILYCGIMQVMGQKMDSVIFLSVSNGQEYSPEDMYNFHESDFLLSETDNDHTSGVSEQVIVFYNDVHTDYDYYVFYIRKQDKIIKSRYIQIKKVKK